MLNIKVGRVNNCDYKVDRTTILGNPFKMFNESERDKVCDNYYRYFEEKISQNDRVILEELQKIKHLASKKPVFTIGCHCAPRRCHGDTIANFLNNYSDSI